MSHPFDPILEMEETTPSSTPVETQPVVAAPDDEHKTLLGQRIERLEEYQRNKDRCCVCTRREKMKYIGVLGICVLLAIVIVVYSLPGEHNNQSVQAMLERNGLGVFVTSADISLGHEWHSGIIVDERGIFSDTLFIEIDEEEEEARVWTSRDPNSIHILTASETRMLRLRSIQKQMHWEHMCSMADTRASSVVWPLVPVPVDLYRRSNNLTVHRRQDTTIANPANPDVIPRAASANNDQHERFAYWVLQNEPRSEFEYAVYVQQSLGNYEHRYTRPFSRFLVEPVDVVDRRMAILEEMSVDVANSQGALNVILYTSVDYSAPAVNCVFHLNAMILEQQRGNEADLRLVQFILGAPCVHDDFTWQTDGGEEARVPCLTSTRMAAYYVADLEMDQGEKYKLCDNNHIQTQTCRFPLPPYSSVYRRTLYPTLVAFLRRTDAWVVTA